MKREKWYISTIDSDGARTAKQYGLGLEIAEYCTAWNMDDHFDAVHPKVLEEVGGIPNLVLHAPFNELFPCADELIEFAGSVRHAIFVSDYIYSDAERYSESTEMYRKCLASIDRSM